MIWIILASAIAGLFVRAVVQYRAASGAVADKLAAAWRGSLTIFVLAWGMILTLGVQALDIASQVTGDAQFSQFADSVKALIPAQYHPVIPPIVMGVAIAARLSHNPPGK
jgi:hypothetical protein